MTWRLAAPDLLINRQPYGQGPKVRSRESPRTPAHGRSNPSGRVKAPSIFSGQNCNPFNHVLNSGIPRAIAGCLGQDSDESAVGIATTAPSCPPGFHSEPIAARVSKRRGEQARLMRSGFHLVPKKTAWSSSSIHPITPLSKASPVR